ncbi:putative Regulator of nonsense-mediated decay; UPF3 [Paratrimastix pyriformis]|uniref:Regulator of nonsense-mediated decay n=1 Tax=Paratrimastix pyriformis TaxID=342808 RepID=A0ABQ8UF00_9EUKA|nr:putative Regulator of nonsense-mediated decay; UPF3 [Paratrimastix pyriformis]
MEATEQQARTKVLVRNLPPTMSEAQFLHLLDQSYANKYDFFFFVQGKSTAKKFEFSTAFINFKNPSDVISFNDDFDGYPFPEAQTRALVEYAPNQKVPKPSEEERQSIAGTIFQDPDYLAFVAKYEATPEQLPSAEVQLDRAAAASESQPKPSLTIPILEFIRQKRQSRAQFKVAMNPRDRRYESKAAARAVAGSKAAPAMARLTRAEIRRRRREQRGAAGLAAAAPSPAPVTSIAPHPPRPTIPNAGKGHGPYPAKHPAPTPSPPPAAAATATSPAPPPATTPPPTGGPHKRGSFGVAYGPFAPKGPGGHNSAPTPPPTANTPPPEAKGKTQAAAPAAAPTATTAAPAAPGQGGRTWTAGYSNGGGRRGGRHDVRQAPTQMEPPPSTPCVRACVRLLCLYLLPPPRGLGWYR